LYSQAILYFLLVRVVQFHPLGPKAKHHSSIQFNTIILLLKCFLIRLTYFLKVSPTVGQAALNSCEILLQFKMTVFYFNIFLRVSVPVMPKLIFQHHYSSLQCHMILEKSWQYAIYLLTIDTGNSLLSTGSFQSLWPKHLWTKDLILGHNGRNNTLYIYNEDKTRKKYHTLLPFSPGGPRGPGGPSLPWNKGLELNLPTVFTTINQINQKHILGTQPLHSAQEVLGALDFLVAPADLPHPTGLCFLVVPSEDCIYKCFTHITNHSNTG